MNDRQPESHFTFHDYQQWKAHMNPTPGRRHQDVVFCLARQLADALEGSPCRVYLASFDIRLPRGAEEDADIATVVQPEC